MRWNTRHKEPQLDGLPRIFESRIPPRVIERTCKSTFVGNPLGGSACETIDAIVKGQKTRCGLLSACCIAKSGTTTLVEDTFHVLRQYLHRDTLHEESRRNRRAALGIKGKAEPITTMKSLITQLVGWTRIAVMSFLIFQLCVAAFAQELNKTQDLGSPAQPSQTGKTGTGVWTTGMTDAKTGQADDMGNLELGGKRRPLYRLNDSDIVALSFTLAPEFDQLLTVQPDGFVALKDVKPVFAQGLTLEEFREAVGRAYTGYLHDPEVAVALKDFQRPYFVAGGEVGRPGKYELRADTSILEAVEIAGGFTHVAKHSQVLLFRHVNDNLIEAHIFNLKKMLKDKSVSEASELRPGDMVFVPQNSISKIERFLSKPSYGLYMSSTQF
jgi:polysaccharide biosynthesis/export protein